MAKTEVAGVHYPNAWLARRREACVPHASQCPKTGVKIMGSVFRKSTCRPVPAGAILATDEAGQETVQWVPRRASRPIVAPVKTLAGGRKVIVVATGAFYAKYRDADGFVQSRLDRMS